MSEAHKTLLRKSGVLATGVIINVSLDVKLDFLTLEENLNAHCRLSLQQCHTIIHSDSSQIVQKRLFGKILIYAQ